MLQPPKALLPAVSGAGDVGPTAVSLSLNRQSILKPVFAC